MTVEESINAFGLRRHAQEQLEQIRNRLAEETEKEGIMHRDVACDFSSKPRSGADCAE